MKVYILLSCFVTAVVSQSEWLIHNPEYEKEVVQFQGPFEPFVREGPGSLGLGEASEYQQFPTYLERRKRATGYSYSTPDGISRSEQYETYVDPRVADRHPLNRITGRVSYTSPEGLPVTYTYVADGSGYHVLPA